MNAEFQRIAGIDKKAFLCFFALIAEEKYGMGTLEIFSRKLEIPIPKEHFMQRWAQ